jgi:hypothetical protein
MYDMTDVLTSVAQMGAKSSDPRFGNDWEDVDEEGGQAQCQPQ